MRERVKNRDSRLKKLETALYIGAVERGCIWSAPFYTQIERVAAQTTLSIEDEAIAAALSAINRVLSVSSEG